MFEFIYTTDNKEREKTEKAFLAEKLCEVTSASSLDAPLVLMRVKIETSF